MEYIGSKYGTDKTSRHGYQRFYPHFMDFMKDMDDVAMLEIGVESKSSLKMWLEYFPKAFVYGADIGVEGSGDNYKIIKCDQSDIKHLINLKNSISHKTYIIIDDGSHVPEHQILTFNYLFDNLLEDDGLYIIEDIETSYWSKGGLYGYSTRYGYKHPNSLVEKMKNICDYVNREYMTDINMKKLENTLVEGGFDLNVLKQIKFIVFCHNCVIIKKNNKSDYIYYERKYHFHENL